MKVLSGDDKQVIVYKYLKGNGQFWLEKYIWEILVYIYDIEMDRIFYEFRIERNMLFWFEN